MGRALSADELERLVGLITALGFEDKEIRSYLLYELPKGFVSGLPVYPLPDIQLRTDLQMLNACEALKDFDGRPLAAWLRRAYWLAHARKRVESEALAQLLALTGGIPGKAPTIVSQLPEGLAPYRGLAAFEAEHALVFLGRDEDIGELVRRLDEGARLITVVAASGAGKSSLVRAGLVPKAREGAFGGGSWATAVMVPGSRPCESLALALVKALPAARGERSLNRAAIELTEELLEAAEKPAFAATLRNTTQIGQEGAGLLLVVDQLEELFTLGAEVERRAFVANLIEALQADRAPVRIVLTMRADFTGHFLQDPGLGPQLQSSVFFLEPMDAERLRKVVETPAHLAGHRFEPGLVDELVRETLGEPGHLPLLAFVLDQLWQRRDAELGALRWEAYKDLGGLRGAINAHAEATVAKLGNDRLLRDLFGHLVTPGQGVPDTRHRETRAELGEEAGPLVDALVNARLLTTRSDAKGQPEVEIAHEALIREWPRLRGWLDAEREGLVLRRQIEQAAMAWAQDAWDRGNRWQGGKLQRAIELRDAGHPRLADDERTFVDACEAAEAEEAHMEASRRRRLQDQVRLSVAQKLSATDPVAASLALTEVAEPDASGQTIELLVELASASWRPCAVILGGSAAFGPDGHRIVTTSEGGTARVWNAGGTGIPVILQGPNCRVWSAAFSPDGRLVVTASDDGIARVWNTDGTGTPILLSCDTHPIRLAAFSPNGRLVVTASEDGTARVWNVEGTGAPVLLRGHTKAVRLAEFSPDGQRIVTASYDGTARVWNVGGVGTVVLLSHTTEVGAVGFSPDGGSIVTGSGDGIVRIWNADGDGTPTLLQGHQGWVRSVEFSPDGGRIVTASDDGTARIWSADGKGTPILFQGHTRPVASATFSPNGQRVVTASFDGTARVWSADGTGNPAILQGHKERVHSAEFSPDGRCIVTASDDGTARVWKAAHTGAVVVLQGHTRAVEPARFSPDGRCIVTASDDETARVWKADGTGDPIILHGHALWVLSAEFSPDGRHIVTASSDGTARVWNADGTGTPLILLGHTKGVSTAAFSPDGRCIVTACADGTARVWNADGTGTPFILLGHTGGVESAEFSPDGRRIVTTSDDHTARVWSVDGVGDPVTLFGHVSGVLSAKFSPDGRRIVTASHDRTARVWTVHGTGATIILKGHTDSVRSAVFSPDGRHIVTASNDRTARVWSVDGKGTSVILKGHTGMLRLAAFSPDGKRIVTTSWDKTARVWNTDGTGAPIILKGHTDFVRSAAFSPDGRRIVTASDDHTARVWTIDGRILQTQLDTEIRWCLPADFRMAHFGETSEEAEAAFRACQQRKDLPDLASPEPLRFPD